MLKFLLKIKRCFRRLISRVLDVPTIATLRLFGGYLSLSYDNSGKKDGLGAQIQRVLGTFALSNILKVKYFHSTIKDIAVHPLDPYQQEKEYFDFLTEVNDFILLPNTSITYIPERTVHLLNELGHKRLFLIRLAFSSWMHREETLIFLTEPYFIVDSWPKSYRDCLAHLGRKEISLLIEETSNEIVIHYRWGVGGMAIQNGEKYPRELPVEYFQKVLENILIERNGRRIEHLVILTDAPQTEIIYQPPADQVGLWDGSPRFDDGKMYVKGADFFDVFEQYAEHIQIVRGGNALDAIKRMARANVLIMSKSSLSYVAGIMSTSTEIYYPPNFWHPKLDGWKSL